MAKKKKTQKRSGGDGQKFDEKAMARKAGNLAYALAKQIGKFVDSHNRDKDMPAMVPAGFAMSAIIALCVKHYLYLKDVGLRISPKTYAEQVSKDIVAKLRYLRQPKHKYGRGV